MTPGELRKPTSSTHRAQLLPVLTCGHMLEAVIYTLEKEFFFFFYFNLGPSLGFHRMS